MNVLQGVFKFASILPDQVKGKIEDKEQAARDKQMQAVITEIARLEAEVDEDGGRLSIEGNQSTRRLRGK